MILIRRLLMAYVLPRVVAALGRRFRGRGRAGHTR